MFVEASKQDAGMAAFSAGLASGLSTYASLSGGKKGAIDENTPKEGGNTVLGEGFMAQARNEQFGFRPRLGSSWMNK